MSPSFRLRSAPSPYRWLLAAAVFTVALAIWARRSDYSIWQSTATIIAAFGAGPPRHCRLAVGLVAGFDVLGRVVGWSHFRHLLALGSALPAGDQWRGASCSMSSFLRMPWKHIMTVADDHLARCPIQAWLTQAFRPFFLAASVWSAAALAVWIVLLITGTALPSRFDPPAWHIHEMLFGFVMAAVAAFAHCRPELDEAAPRSRLPLAILAGLWFVGRILCLVSALVPAWLAIAADLAFPAALVAVTTREIAVGRNWRNLPMVAPVAVLGIANLLMHLEASGVRPARWLGWRLGLAAVDRPDLVVAGRIVPSFTRNWLAKRRILDSPRRPRVDRPGGARRPARRPLRLGVPSGVPPARLRASACATLNLWRLIRWRGDATLAEPLLIILHIGYAWLVVGTALLGLAESRVPIFR